MSQKITITLSTGFKFFRHEKLFYSSLFSKTAILSRVCTDELKSSLEFITRHNHGSNHGIIGGSTVHKRAVLAQSVIIVVILHFLIFTVLK
jgi:hypothetical protein